MKEFKNHYVISRENSQKAFKNACNMIEANYPSAKKTEYAEDVDGSTVQVYDVDGEEIVVIDDYDIGVVFADSNIEIANIFGVFAA